MRTTLLFAALVWAATAQAFTSADLPSDLPIAQGKPATTPADDDEEDPNPGAKSAPKADAPKPEEKKDVPAGAINTTPPTSGDAQKLVSGAPLFNPNVAVHIVEQKAFSDSGKREVILFPAQIQVNGKFTQHFGAGLGFVWHVQENFGFQVSGFYNYSSAESGFNGELIDKVRAEAQAATSLLNVWGVLGGIEVTPFYGKFAWYENNLAHFSIVLNGGLGIGGTRHQLKPVNMAGGPGSPGNAATFGDTGLRFLGGLGGGLRLQLGKHFAIRLEVRDVVYTARVDQVNGCQFGDLKAMDTALRNGQKFPKVDAGCRVEKFEGVDPVTMQPRGNDVPLALNLVKPPASSDVLNNLGLYLGAAFLF
jgi:outer membrane beta-barrel protein